MGHVNRFWRREFLGAGKFENVNLCLILIQFSSWAFRETLEEAILVMRFLLPSGGSSSCIDSGTGCMEKTSRSLSFNLSSRMLINRNDSMETIFPEHSTVDIPAVVQRPRISQKANTTPSYIRSATPCHSLPAGVPGLLILLFRDILNANDPPTWSTLALPRPTTPTTTATTIALSKEGFSLCIVHLHICDGRFAEFLLCSADAGAIVV